MPCHRKIQKPANVITCNQIVIWDAKWKYVRGYLTRKHKIFLDGKKKGHLYDGRPVVKVDGEWRYEVR